MEHFRIIKRQNVRATLGVTSALLLSGLAPAIEIHVPDDYATIQEAIDWASDGDEIVVSPGVYRTGYIDFREKQIILRSTNPFNWDTVAKTVIVRDGGGGMIWLSSAGQVLGLTIKGANRGGGWWNGAISGGGLTARIAHNIITSNSAVAGGGICSSQATIEQNIITRNSASEGGGLHGCGGRVIRNLIANNTADTGGGLNHCSGDNSMIANNIITSNSGAALYYCTHIYNNTITDNVGGGLRNCYEIANCIIWGNDVQLIECSVPSYSCVEGHTVGGVGNTGANPLFIDSDFRLHPRSPCIDAGTNENAPSIDKDGNPRPVDGDGDGQAVCDMGAYEYVGPTFTSVLRQAWTRYK